MQTLPVMMSTLVLLILYLPKTYADDSSKGRDVFIRNCIACHAFACNKQGPRLGGFLGRKAGGVADYGFYTEEFKNSNTIWTEETLDGFFKNPASIAP